MTIIPGLIIRNTSIATGGGGTIPIFAIFVCGERIFLIFTASRTFSSFHMNRPSSGYVTLSYSQCQRGVGQQTQMVDQGKTKVVEQYLQQGSLGEDLSSLGED